MRLSAPLLTLAGTVAGTAAAVVAYQATAAGSPTKPVSVSTETPAPASSTTWLPCEHGWKVHGTTCVRIKQKVVVVHDLPAPAAAPAQTAGVRSGSSGVSGRDSASDDDGTEVEDATADDSGNEAGDQSADDASGDDSDHEDVGGDD